jgi:hypothetical protein
MTSPQPQYAILKNCSLFPDISYSEQLIYCSIEPIPILPDISQIALSGSYKRLNSIGQLNNHIIHSTLTRKYKFSIYHTQSFEVANFQISDIVQIIDNSNRVWNFKNISLEQNIEQSDATYITTITGSIYDIETEVCNVSSSFVKEANNNDPLFLINTIEITNSKPSYTGTVTLTVAASVCTFTIPLNDLNNNIVLNDYLYCHANVNLSAFGISTVKCTGKTASLLTFTGQGVATASTLANVAVVLNYEISLTYNASVVARALTYYIYTDFDCKKDFNKVYTGKDVQITQARKINTKLELENFADIPFVLTISELWKATELVKGDLIKFIGQSETLTAISFPENLLTDINNENFLDIRAYILRVVYAKEAVNLNKY